MIVQILSTLGSYASLLSLILVIRDPSRSLGASHVFLFAFATALLLTALGTEVYRWRKSQPRRCHSPRQIRDYMYKWISSAGRVAIFSHDMSWVNDNEMRNLLRQKAQASELRLCLPGNIALADDLRAEGAHVCVYPQLQYVPLSRFTIINLGRMDAQVAVGRNISGTHVIEEFSAGTHPVFAVANDLVEVITRISHPGSHE